MCETYIWLYKSLIFAKIKEKIERNESLNNIT